MAATKIKAPHKFDVPRYRPAAPNHIVVPHAPLLPNRRTLIVGQQLMPSSYFLQSIKGFPVDFPTIAAAMDAIPLVDDVEKHNFTDRWVILVTPGYYEEEIHMKPFVTVTGLAPDTVLVQAPPGPRRTYGGRRATVYMNHHTSLQNVGILLRAGSESFDYAIWNKSTYPSVFRKTDNPNKSDVSNLGVQNVNIWPGIDSEKKSPEDPRGELNRGKAILLEGDFSTVIMTNVGLSYNFTRGYAVEISGVRTQRGRDELVSNADTHFIQCFFDSLFLTPGQAPGAEPGPGFGFGGGEVPGGFGFGAASSQDGAAFYAPFEGGCIRVRDCMEVSIRNSLARVAADRDAEPRTGFTNGAAVRVESHANVIIEGSSLLAPGTKSDRVLDVEAGSYCTMYHSATDSVRGGKNVRQVGPLPVDANGVIIDGPV